MVSEQSKTSLIVWDNDRSEIRLIARGVLKGIRWFRRLFRVDCADSCSIVLDDYLRRLAPPRKLLLIAHGRNGRFWFKPDPMALDEALPRDWWGVHDEALGVYALGCSSVECFNEYKLASRVSSYLGYKDEISFFVGTRRGRRIFRELLGRIGTRFAKSATIDEYFRSGLAEDYEAVMDTVAKKYRAKRGDRLSLIFLEEQVQGLELLRGEA